MTFAPEVVPWPHRLGAQLQVLSELSETLTLRLLVIEERLGACERQLGRLDGNALKGSAAMEELLEQTEDRLSRLESLLEQETSHLLEQECSQQPARGVRSEPRLQVLHAPPERHFAEPAPELGLSGDRPGTGLEPKRSGSERDGSVAAHPPADPEDAEAAAFGHEPFPEEGEQVFMDELSA